MIRRPPRSTQSRSSAASGVYKRQALNPARATAAAIFSDGWAFGQLWLFWVAPLAGAGIAALIYRAFAAERVRDDLLGESDTEEIVFAEGYVAETPTV